MAEVHAHYGSIDETHLAQSRSDFLAQVILHHACWFARCRRGRFMLEQQWLFAGSVAPAATRASASITLHGSARNSMSEVSHALENSQHEIVEDGTSVAALRKAKVDHYRT
jgi:hypothetical protein